MGAIAGMVLAFYYRELGPKRKKYSWEIEEELGIEPEEPYWEIDQSTHYGNNKDDEK
jgi:hypothetical protein